MRSRSPFLSRTSAIYGLLVVLMVSVVTSYSSTVAFIGNQRRYGGSMSTQTTISSSSALYVAVDTSDIKTGLTVELDGEPHRVINFSIMKQARGAAKTTIKFKNLIRGTTIENTYRSGEKFETALVEKLKAQFTYKEGVSIINIKKKNTGSRLLLFWKSFVYIAFFIWILLCTVIIMA